MATINYLQGYAFAKKKGDTICVFEGPHTLADFMPVIAEGSDVPRMLKDRFADVVNVKDFGAVGNGVHDDTEALYSAILYGSASNKSVFIPSGTYRFTDLSFPSGNYDIFGDNAVLFSDKETPKANDYAIRFYSNAKVYKENYLYQVSKGDTKIPRANFDVAAGDLVVIYSSQLIPTDHRDNWRIGCLCKCHSVDDDYIYLCDPFPFDFKIGQMDMTVTESISKTQCKFGSVNVEDAEAMMYKAVCVSGANEGESFALTKWDNESKVATFGTVSLSGDGKSSWTNVPAVGEVYRLVKEIQISIEPTTRVHLHGKVHLTRKFVTTAADGDESFGGLKIYIADSPIVDGWRFSNFPNFGLSFELCYRPESRHCIAENANRIFNGADGTGYGFAFAGCYAANLNNFVASGCRSGFSCAHGGACDVYASYSFGNIYAGRTKSYSGKDMYPVGNLQQYGFGGHGNSYKATYSNITVCDCELGASLRDWDSCINACTFSGLIREALFIQNVRGLQVLNSVYKPFYSNEANHFIGLRGNVYNQNGNILLFGNIAYDLNNSFIHVSDVTSDSVIENISVINNKLRFVGESAQLLGIRGSTTNFKLNNCEFYGNNFIYEKDVQYRGFFHGAYSAVKDNGFIRVAEDRWLVQLLQDGEVVIDLKNSYTQTRNVSITTHDGTIGLSLALYSSPAADLSPLSSSNTSGIHVMTSESDIQSDNLNISITNGRFSLINKMSKTLRLLVSAS